jgi:hypothetical protein
MAEDISKNPQERAPIDETRDPEHEIPDPEQVERDIEKAEEAYNDHEREKPAA